MKFPEGCPTATRILLAGLTTGMLTVTLTGCKAGGHIYVVNNTGRQLQIYIANADPSVPGRVPHGTVPADVTGDINIDINEGCQRYALEAFDGDSFIARREGPTCVGDSWTINNR